MSLETTNTQSAVTNDFIKPFILNCKLAPTPQNNPKYFVKEKLKSGEEIVLGDPRTTRALVALMNQHAVIGGAAAHWGGPAAFAEIMSATHALMFKKSNAKENLEWHQKYNFINDAGHTENGIYALRANYGFDNLTFNDLKKFRSIESKLTGHGEAHLNPEGVLISNGPLGSGVAQAQGLAMADKLANNNRTTILTLSDGGSMEGEAKEAFAAIPGLAKVGKLNPFIMIISDNNTKLSGRIDKDSFSMEPTFESLSTLGFKVLNCPEGHNLSKVLYCIEEALDLTSRDPRTPVIIWFKTIKGKGVKSTEESPSGGHGYPLKPYDQNLLPFLQEIYNNQLPTEFENWAKEILSQKPTGEKAPATPKEKVQKGVSKALFECAQAGYPVVSLTADLAGSTGVSDFQKKYPNRTFDLGVAESNMVSSAIGFSVNGFIPVIDTFAQFAITKGNLPLIMASLSQGPIIGMLSHTGFQDAADGASHQATTYFSALAGIPHTQLISLSCSGEAHRLITSGIEYFSHCRKNNTVPDSLIYFLGREDYLANFSAQAQDWGKPQTLSEGSDLLIVATGPTVEMALAAKELLLKQGKNVTVVNHAFINRPDAQAFSSLLEKNKFRLLTVEDHQIVGGMGQMLIHALVVTSKIQFKATTLGINGDFGQSSYSAKQLYQKHGFDTDAIVQHSLKMMLA